jgi:hypothetical protein
MASVTVKVLDGWAVFDGTSQRGGGAVLEVDSDTAAQWEKAGWVERVTEQPRQRGTQKPAPD